MTMSEEHYQELLRLKNLSSVPSVQKVLEDMINDRPKSRQNDSNSSIRKPIKRSRAETQTIYITKGYAWSQSSGSILLYIPLENASEFPKNCFSLKIVEKTVELNITISFLCKQKGAIYNFKINQLFDHVKSDNAIIKCKANKIVVTLEKINKDIEWADLRTKTTHATYNELERYEKKYESGIQDNFETPFFKGKATDTCSKHSKIGSSNSNTQNENNKEND